ncbi:unnamed protein product [Schistocephalus solidus]|uniref:Homeobox domain-containing protein n=1 Tax=Schistocephalus solidus TaxID=70667 RepID=A0A183SLJ0_SCHSO|nr:unnamed protein product [Schistocephalus solidus]
MWPQQDVHKSDMVNGRLLQSPLMIDRSGALTCVRKVGCYPSQSREHKQMELNLPLSYGSCYFPTIPAPQELLSSTWFLTRPAEYIHLLQSLMAAWRVFAFQTDASFRSAQQPTSFLGVTVTQPDSQPYDLSSWTSALVPTAEKNTGCRRETRQSSSSELSPPDSLPSSQASSPPVIERMLTSPIAPSTAKRYRKARVYFQPKDLSILENFYKKQSYLSSREREILAQQLGITEDRV